MKAAKILTEKLSNKEPTIGLLATFHLSVELVETAIAGINCVLKVIAAPISVCVLAYTAPTYARN
jgi:hypothetical protein